MFFPTWVIVLLIGALFILMGALTVYALKMKKKAPESSPRQRINHGILMVVSGLVWIPLVVIFLVSDALDWRVLLFLMLLHVSYVVWGCFGIIQGRREIAKEAADNESPAPDEPATTDSESTDEPADE